MNNKLLMPVIGSAAIGSLATSCAPKVEPQEEKRPNILWIIAEDMAQDLACYGCAAVKTPNLDRLAAEGVLYTNARSCAPVSSPTRSAMMTGLHQEITASHNHRSNRDLALPDSIKPFTYFLREAGYTCILGSHDCFSNDFTKNEVESSLKVDCNFRWEKTGPYDGKENFGLFDKLYDLDVDKDMPFFRQVTLYVTHRGDWWKSHREQSAHPVNAAEVKLPPFMPDHPKVREEFACYLDQVEYMDAEVGKLMKELEEKNLLDNTIVIFHADNGRGDVRGKGFLYNEGTRVPMIVWGKGIKHAVVDEMVSELDLTASVLHLAGIEQPSYYQGQPLAAFTSAEPTDEAGHEWVYTARDTWDEVHECMRAIDDKQYIYIRNYRPQDPYDQHHIYMDMYRPALHIMRRLKEEGKLNKAQLLFLADSKPVEELYDYKADPFCINNLALEPSMQPLLNMMRNRMDEWQRDNRDAGIEDHLRRGLETTRGEKYRQRYYAMTYKPEEWKKITEGEICDKYDQWKVELFAKRAELGDKY